MSTPDEPMMWIEKIKPELVGGKSTLPDCLSAEGLSRGWSDAQCAELAAMLPGELASGSRQIHCSVAGAQVHNVAGTLQVVESGPSRYTATFSVNYWVRNARSQEPMSS